ncbi:MAG: hypothetical protein GX811_02805 [Lentisphaerae bacterium]|nr:hypothetical protein [Lentisphaerota bacterium]
MKTKCTLISLVFCLLIQAGFSKTIGLHKDGSCVLPEGLIKTLNDAGWETVFVTNADLANEEKLADLDILFFTGGWNRYFFPDFEARREVIKFVASGKGVLSTGFRSGYSRTANRPMFPQVGATYNRGNASFVTGVGDSPMAKAISAPVTLGGWDHMTLEMGPQGKVFAECAGDPIGAYGEVYGGRVVTMGVFLGHNSPEDGMTGVGRDLLLSLVNWLTSAPQRTPDQIKASKKQADLEFLRRERIWDWTLAERGPDRGLGVIPNEAFQIIGHLDGLRARISVSIDELPKHQAQAIATKGKLDVAIKTIKDRQSQITADMIRQINRASEEKLLNELTIENLVDFDVRGKLLAGIEYDKLCKDSVAIANRLLRTRKKAKSKALAQELRQDRKTVETVLIQKATSKHIDTRRNAVLELARIGAPVCVAPLMVALTDEDETVRVTAILGLGWMQAKAAVPELIKLTEDKNQRIVRRATQALGQIGDKRAIPTLLKLAEGTDTFIVENAFFSLGWLKAKEAVPLLIEKVEILDKNNAIERGWRLSAIRALGYIGDKRAIPILKNVIEEGDDYPLNRSGSSKLPNAYSTGQSLGFAHYAQEAIEAIKAGGSSKPGVSQLAELSSADRFYALTRRFNAFAGRPYRPSLIHMGGDDGACFAAFLKEAGWTGIHMAWDAQDADPEEYFKLIQALSDYGMILVGTWPTDGNILGKKRTVTASRQMALEKVAGDLLAERYRNVSAFAGLWSEETWPWIHYSPELFEQWFKDKYGKDPRAHYGLPADDPLTREFVCEGIMKSDFLTFGADTILSHWQESQDWMTGLRKGTAMTFSISHRHMIQLPGLTANLYDSIDVPGPEAYQSFGRDNAFMMEMYKNGRPRPVMCEYYNWYTPSPAHEIRGYAQHLMHGECFFSFAFEHIFPYTTAYNWTWAPTRWESSKTIFQKAKKLKEYLSVPESAANVAILNCEASAVHLNSLNTLGSRWYQQQAGLWTMLNQSQIPTDMIWTENLDPDHLARYDVVIIADTRIIDDRTAGILSDWVKKGGVLIGGGATSIYDRTFKPLKDYALADLFGVRYNGFVGVSDQALHDTLAYDGKNYGPVISSLEIPAVTSHIVREIKPVKSIGTYKVTKTEPLPGMTVGAECEYDMPLGYDKVTVTSAEVIATFDNGDPAITVNTVGEGICYFWTPICPGLCYLGTDYENDANKKDFWPNVREVATAMVNGGLARVKKTLPVEVTGVTKEIEVTLRQQPEYNRTMVHLLDYDALSKGVPGSVMKINVPAGNSVSRVWYPDTGTELTLAKTDQGVSVKLRSFKVHDMAVIEWVND